MKDPKDMTREELVAACREYGTERMSHAVSPEILLFDAVADMLEKAIDEKKLDYLRKANEAILVALGDDAQAEAKNGQWAFETDAADIKRIRAERDDLKIKLADVVAELDEHNREYHYTTCEKKIELLTDAVMDTDSGKWKIVRQNCRAVATCPECNWEGSPKEAIAAGGCPKCKDKLKRTKQ
jgi:hypothetical protein